jgi:geranylgeranylglycerol-phosphate geranylgeranyltransferase
MRASAFLFILRPHNMLASALAVAAGAYIARPESGLRCPPGSFGLVAAAGVVALLAALVTGAGNILNDYFDLQVDRINKPRRPLPSGHLTPRAALVWYVVLTLAVTAVAVSFWPAPVAVMIVAWEVALAVYAKWAKRWLVAGNLLVAAISSSAFVAGAMTACNARAAVIPAAIAFAFVLCREIVKGAEDVEGDRRGGVHTLAVVLGAPRAGSIAATLMLVLAALMPLPVLLAGYRPGYFFVMELMVVPVLLASALRVAGSAERHDYTITARSLKLGMFVGIVAIALGA